MKKILITIFLVLAAAVSVAAQDDCPADHVRNPPLQPIGANNKVDHAVMLAQFRASFVGIFGREPSMRPGSGKDDGEYYIGAADHYGLYGDDQCHAGWSGYWESWLQTGHGDLALVQTPARFLPQPAPLPVPPIPVPVPVPVPLPTVQTCDLSQVYVQLAAINDNVTAGRAENRTFFEAVRGEWKRILTYAAPIIGSIYVGRATKP